ncbi:LuxR C-terminal-related transcriptional regulator [Mumia qirimensis]|uniref:LuxR C-terminal-related transcriptional regulator n=1 Tax=Mumia qirimensis TaxID=3234852 RepID=UPI00351CB939
MTDHVIDGRVMFDRRAWAGAFAALSMADREAPLAPDDLELLAMAAYLVGRFDDGVACWERVYQVCRDEPDVTPATRAAFWLAFVLLNDGELARGAAWVHRAQRLLDRNPVDCVERGYVAYCAALRCVFDGDPAGAAPDFGAAAAAGERFGNDELVALAQVGRGRCLIRTGEVAAGMALLDEAMSTVLLGAVSPVAVGDLYCTVIDGCREVFDVRRAQEWTAALSRWCDAQPDLVLYRGQCLVHRAELMLLGGLWPQARVEAERACERLARPRSQPALGAAYYVRAELHRMRGEQTEAESGYRRAHAAGREPQPGLALLRLAQGRTAEAASALVRGLEEARSDPLTRARLLGPYVEVALATGDVASARESAEELAGIASASHSPYLDATSAYARGSVLLAEGEAGEALPLLRGARAGWVELEAPYEAARTRILVARACGLLGDQDSAGRELSAARTELAGLGALSDVERRRDGPRLDGLTPREHEVLRELATGKTNRAVASALFISEKTAASHVSNILRKLGLESRAAATAYAHQHHLL